MSKVETELVLYSDEYRQDLHYLLLEASKELFGYRTVDLQSFLDYHWAIYLAVVNGKVIGFTSFVLNPYFGLRPMTLGNDYIYILPEYRLSKAMYMLSIQAGKVCVEADLPMEHYYCSEESKKISRKLNGTKLYEAYVYDVSEINRVYKNLTKKIKIKD